MHHHILRQIAQRLDEYKYIKFISRIDDTTIVIEFEGKERYFFDLKRGNSSIYKKSETIKQKTYQAPFDIALKKRFLKGVISKIYAPEDKKVIVFDVEVKNSYTKLTSRLYLEFVGRNTNAIITDEQDVIIDALRHSTSSDERMIGVGAKLESLAPRVFKNTSSEIGDIDSYLEKLYEDKELTKLEEVKNRARAKVQKEIDKFQKLLNGLEDEASLSHKSDLQYEKGNLLLSHLHAIKAYQKSIVLKTYEDKEIEIELPEKVSVTSLPSYYFDRAKKAKQKALNIHIERDNLQAKLDFAKRLVESVLSSSSVIEIGLMVPKKIVSKKDRKSSYLYEVFKIEDFLLYVGKSEKGNTELLKKSNSSDIWMHMQDYPSTHVIIKTQKSNIPESVLVFAGKLCVNFTNIKAGGYLVDYTKRKFVKTIDGSFVSYTHQKSLKIFKE